MSKTNKKRNIKNTKIDRMLAWVSLAFAAVFTGLVTLLVVFAIKSA